MKKTYVLDTNVLLLDPNSIFSFEENDVIIPMVVLEELDRQKTRPDEPGRNARHISRVLDDLRKNGSLSEGVPLPGGGMLKISTLKELDQNLPPDMNKDKVDNLIILYMLELKSSGVDAKLVSKDINVRVKCDALGIVSEDYLKVRIEPDLNKFYRGVDTLIVSNDEIGSFYDHKTLAVDEKFCPNQIIVLKSKGESGSAITRYVDSRLVPVNNVESVYGLKPRNKEQNFSLDLLLDPSVKLMTLVGPAGTGKTLLALASALQQVLENKTYSKLIITRPIQPMGKDLGYLPGDIKEKMDPWIAPIRDNLNFLLGHNKNSKRKKGGMNEPYLDLMQENGILEIEAITYIRGRSIPNSFIIIDEAQNLSVHELKTIITRVGDGTKIVLTGDIEQIDNVNVDVFNNGLTYAVEKFKEHAIAAHVTLLKGERSELATLASKIL